MTNTIDDSFFTHGSLANQAGSNIRVLTYSSSGQIGPILDGTVGQVLSTDGAGVLSWATPGGGATALNGLSDCLTDMSAGNEQTAIHNAIEKANTKA